MKSNWFMNKNISLWFIKPKIALYGASDGILREL